MTQLDTGDIELSAGAVAELFRLYMRQWSLAVGRVDFAKTIGVSASRLNRAIAGATPAYDLAYRIVKTCRVSWPAIFTASSATIGTLKKIARAEEDRDISLSEREVAAEEAHTRARLRDIVGEFGFMECARGAGIAPASLHYYLDSTRLTLSLIWKVHLVTGTPYTAIASGKADSRELKLRESAGRDDEPLGRFEDAVEPVVRLVERYVYNEMSEAARPYVACTEKLLDRKLTLPQKMRVMKVLALYLDDMGDRKAAVSSVLRSWREIIRAKAGLNLLLSHLTVSGHIGAIEHAQEVADHILKATDDPRVVSQVYRVQAEIAGENLEVYKAQALTRKALHTTRNAPPAYRPLVLAQLELALAVSAWLFGDYGEALSRLGRLLASPITPLHIKRSGSELEANIRIWLRDYTGANRALKSLESCCVSEFNTQAARLKLDIYRLRWLAGKKESGAELSGAEEKKLRLLLEKLPASYEKNMDPENMVVLAVSLYRTNKDTGLLKKSLDKITDRKRPGGGVALYSLPDLVEAAGDGGLWDKKSQSWQARAIEKGALFFNMTRPRG